MIDKPSRDLLCDLRDKIASSKDRSVLLNDMVLAMVNRGHDFFTIMATYHQLKKLKIIEVVTKITFDREHRFGTWICQTEEGFMIDVSEETNK